VLRVGLTGGMATGKSTVAEMFTRCGAHVLHADQVAHQLIEPGQPLYDEVLKRFGSDIVQADGTISRARLGEKAFGEHRIDELNQILHPAVIVLQEEWLAEIAEEDPNGVAMVEAALIFEARVNRRFDKIVVVSCAPEQRASRFAARTGMKLADADKEVQRRMAAQMPEAEKIKAADYVIDNCGTLADTETQVEKIYSELAALARKSVASGH
jgi:dephospho-CoA kinase